MPCVKNKALDEFLEPAGAPKKSPRGSVHSRGGKEDAGEVTAKPAVVGTGEGDARKPSIGGTLRGRLGGGKEGGPERSSSRTSLVAAKDSGTADRRSKPDVGAATTPVEKPDASPAMKPAPARTSVRKDHAVAASAPVSGTSLADAPSHFDLHLEQPEQPMAKRPVSNLSEPSKVEQRGVGDLASATTAIDKKTMILTPAAAAPPKKKQRDVHKLLDPPSKVPFWRSAGYRLQEAKLRDESSDLDKFSVSERFADTYRVLPSEVFRAFADLRDVAGAANTELITPEFVVMGLAGHGKSSVVEAILGWPLMHMDFEVPATRPIHISVHHNPAFVEPRFTLLPDAVLEIKKRTTYSSYEEVRREIQLRVTQSLELDATPIHLLVEYADAVNFDIIECPGIHETKSRDRSVALCVELARPVQRTLLVVEECTPWTGTNQVLMQTVLQLDPDFSRTLFVNTKLNAMLQGALNTDEISRYFTGMARIRPLARSMWVSALSSKARSACENATHFRCRLEQATLRDLHDLRALQCDKSLEASVGMLALRSRIWRLVVAQVRARVPQIHFSLTGMESDAKQAFESVVGMADSLNGAQIKACGMLFVNEFVSSIHNAVDGVVDVNTEQFGQSTLDEGFFGWFDDQLRMLTVPRSEESPVALNTLKLVGAQQFQRLQADLRATLLGLDFSQLPVAQEFSVPPDVPPRSEQANRVAAQWVHSALLRAVVPILTQASERAQRLLSSLFQIYDGEFAVRTSESTEDGTRFVLAHAPYFRSLIRDKYVAFLASKRELLVTQLKEDIMSAETLYWALMTYPATYGPPSMPKKAAKMVDLKGPHPDAHAAARTGLPASLQAQLQAEALRVEKEQGQKLYTVDQIASRMWRVHQKRIAQNATLYMYKHMLEPLLSGDLLGELRSVVDSLSAQTMGEMFSLTAVREQYEARRGTLQMLLHRLQDTTSTYNSASSSFLRYVSAVP